MVIRPVTPGDLVSTIVTRVLDADGPGAWTRVAVDGAPATGPHALAEALVEGVRVGGRAALAVRADDFLRAASLRFEHGRTNPDAYYEDWLDEGGLRRTVLDPLGPRGDGRVVTSLWDSATDRASRAPFVHLPAGGVLVLSGSLLLGGGLPVDLSVHLWMSQAALARRTDPRWRWTLPAFARYEREVAPGTFADVVAKLDHPDRPAIVEPDTDRSSESGRSRP